MPCCSSSHTPCLRAHVYACVCACICLRAFSAPVRLAHPAGPALCRPALPRPAPPCSAPACPALHTHAHTYIQFPVYNCVMRVFLPVSQSLLVNRFNFNHCKQFHLARMVRHGQHHPHIDLWHSHRSTAKNPVRAWISIIRSKQLAIYYCLGGTSMSTAVTIAAAAVAAAAAAAAVVAATRTTAAATTVALTPAAAAVCGTFGTMAIAACCASSPTPARSHARMGFFADCKPQCFNEHATDRCVYDGGHGGSRLKHCLQ